LSIVIDPFHRLSQRLLARPGHQVSAATPQERAAVALVFRPDGDLLFIRRSEREGDPWSGHMAFPGGRMEPLDDSTRAAAARETWEEVGLSLEPARYLGQLDDLESPAVIRRRRLVISAHVWLLDHDPPLKPNVEVAELHWLAGRRLVEGEGRGRFDYSWKGKEMDLPIVHLDGTDIWGITLRIVDDLVARLG
jgi:8-oxo-dGTP pyrophosphatase MutT (NUDIX family)